jgi:SprT protein
MNSISITYRGQEFTSKSAVCREMFKYGDLRDTPDSKKRVANLLNMRVQTVHAAIQNLINPGDVKIPASNKFPNLSHERVIELKNIIENRYNECYQFVKERMPAGWLNDIPHLEIKFDLKGTCAGQFCLRSGGNYFRVNLAIADRDINDYLNQTIPHEFSHYLVRLKWGYNVNAHGKEWKSVMVCLFKLEPKRTHSVNTNGLERNMRRYNYDCGCRVHQVSARKHHSIQRGAVYTCRVCRGRLRKID